MIRAFCDVCGNQLPTLPEERAGKTLTVTAKNIGPTNPGSTVTLKVTNVRVNDASAEICNVCLAQAVTAGEKTWQPSHRGAQPA